MMGEGQEKDGLSAFFPVPSPPSFSRLTCVALPNGFGFFTGWRQHAAYRLKRYKCSGSKSFRTKYLMWHDFTQRQVTFSSAIPVTSLVTGSTFAVCFMMTYFKHQTRSGRRRSQKSSITFVARKLYDDGRNNLFYQCYVRPLNEPFLVNKKEPLSACI